MTRPLPALILLAVVVLGGCVAESRPSGCDDPAVEIELSVTATAMQPGSPSACRGQEVTLLVASEVDAVFHIHGYDDSVPATQVAAGETTTITFTAERAGQFPIEIHPGDDPRGVDVGILTVHAS